MLRRFYLVILLALVVGACGAPSVRPTGDAGVRRLALVIGNGAYRGDIPVLAHPVGDAAAIAATLERNGYRTVLLQDADRTEMLAALRSFAATADGADLALVFFSGHGVEIGGRNLLLPVDFALSAEAGAEEITRRGVRLAEVDEILSGRAKASLIFLDACRTDPTVPVQGDAVADAETRSLPIMAGRGQGLALEAGRSTAAIVYAAQPGQSASDGVGAFSPFATAFLANVSRRNQSVRFFLPRLKLAVAVATDDAQEPVWASIGNDLPTMKLASAKAKQKMTGSVSVVRVATRERPPEGGGVAGEVPAAVALAYGNQVLVQEPGSLPTEYTCWQTKKAGGLQRSLFMNMNGAACGGNILFGHGQSVGRVALGIAPAHGQVVLRHNTFAYLPNTDFIGRDRFVLRTNVPQPTLVTVDVSVE